MSARKNPDYLDRLRELPCAVCGHHAPSNAHHLIGVGGLSGMGLKAPDLFAMPVCFECHANIHDHRGSWFVDQAEALVETLAVAYKEGWFDFKEESE